MNDALRSAKDYNKIRKSRRIEEGKRKQNERALKKKKQEDEKEEKKKEKAEKKQKDKEEEKDKDENKLTRIQSVVKIKNKVRYGNFEEKYISIYGKGNVSDTTKLGTVWQQIHKVRIDDLNEIEEGVIINKLEKAGAKVEEIDDNGEVKRILPPDSNIDDESANHIKNGEITYNSNIIIPYDNAYDVYDKLKENELNENVELIDRINDFDQGNYIRLEQTEKNLRYYCYYIPVIIKARIRFAKIMKYYQEKEISDEKERKRGKINEEKKAKIAKKNEERDDIMKDFDAIDKSIKAKEDILGDSSLLSLPLPFTKLSKAYCYIHPINVILYDKTIEHGLIWSKKNNVINNDDYVDVNNFFIKKNDNDSPNTFKDSFNEEYKKSANKDIIDLSKYKKIVKIIRTHDFSQGNLYYKYEDDNSTYVCEPTKFDYKYKQRSFDKEAYFKRHQISDDLKIDKAKIRALQESLDDKIFGIIDLAEKNINYNKENTYKRQFESDNITSKNANTLAYYISYVYFCCVTYVLDTLFGVVKSLFGSKWNNVMTGFVILIFIIILIMVGISAGGEEKNEGPNKKPKEENKDFFAVIKSIPADMTNIYNSAMKLSSDVGNMMSNSRRTVNDIADAITGDDNSDDIDRPSLADGRGGDNFIHFDNDNGVSVDSKYSMKGTQIDPIINNINYNKQAQLGTINGTITLGVKNVSVNAGEAQMYVPDCTSNKYFNNNCELIERDPDSKVAIVKDSDYEQIKIND